MYLIMRNLMSGEIATSLFGCVVICCIVASFADDVDLFGLISLLNNGDDCVIVCDKSNEEIITRYISPYFLKLGFEMIVEEPVYVLEQIEFCHTHPVWTIDGYVMCRNYPVTINKDLVSYKSHYFNEASGFDLLRNCIGMSGLALAGNLPIYKEFYRMLRRGAEHSTNRHGKAVAKMDDEITGCDYLAKGMHVGDTIDYRSRISFCLAFGVTPGEQEALESYYQGITLEFHIPVEVDDLVDHLQL
jgi:hypothetical protein